jgi:hypothetical protein
MCETLALPMAKEQSGELALGRVLLVQRERECNPCLDARSATKGAVERMTTDV